MLDVRRRAIDQMIRDVRDLTAERNDWRELARAKAQAAPASPPRPARTPARPTERRPDD